jgi:hypothetical protein
VTNVETNRIRTALVGVGLALACVGCAGRGNGSYGGGGATAAASPRALPSAGRLHDVLSAATGLARGTARVVFRLVRPAEFGTTLAPVFGSGNFAFAAGRGTEAIDLPELPHQEHGTEHAVFGPGLVYLQPRGTSGRVLPRGKLWLSASLTGSDSVSTNFPSFIGQVEGVNPQLLLDELLWGATSATPTSQQPTVKGLRAQGYTVSVDLPRALAGAGRAGATAFSLAIQQQLTALAGHGGSTSIQMVAWLDRSGRIAELEASPPGAGYATGFFGFSTFGTPVRVDVPPAAQVIDITALTPSGERESNGGGDSDGA